MADWKETVKEGMMRRGMTRQQLAKELGVNETTVGRWLSGRNSPATGTLRLIGSILGLRLAETGSGADLAAEETELLAAFRRMPGAERRLLLQCLRERRYHCDNESTDAENLNQG